MQALFASCCGQRKKPHHKEGNKKPINEQTPLLDPDTLPKAQPKIRPTNTEAEQKHQAALRAVVDEATERIISISTPAPYLQINPSQHRIKHSSRSSHSSGSSTAQEGSTWRPFPNSSTTPNTHYRSENGVDGSTHTMRTMKPKRRKHERTESDSTVKGNGVVSETEESEAEDDESKFGTVASWHTAQGSNGTGLQDVFGLGENDEQDGIEWAEVTKEEDELMQSTLKKLIESIEGSMNTPWNL